jgi:hypothetical protein
MTPDIAVAIAVIAAASAVVAAAIAALAAVRTNNTTIASQRVIELEKRLATSRLDVFKPMLETMAQMLEPSPDPQVQTERQADMLSALKSFATWVQIYGSDESVRVFHHFMHAAYHTAPPEVFIRLYGQFVLAARRDLGDSNTEVDLVDLLGIRLKDIYAGYADRLRLSDEDYYRNVEWTPPWQ